MSLDRPMFPGEAEVNLSGATLTSSGCTNPGLAIDDDPATATVFGGFAPPVNIAPDVFSITPTFFAGGAYYPPGNYKIAYVQGAMKYAPQFGWVNGQDYVTDGTGNNVVAFPSLWPQHEYDYTTQAAAEAAAAGFSLVYPHAGGPIGMYTLDQDAAAYSNNVAGSPNPTYALLQATTGPRFLRVDWKTDKFITRIRLDQSGSGAANVGIDFESSLGLAEFGPPPPDVPFLAYMPLPLDGTIHELLVQPPFLANGIVFYPDAFLPAGTPAGSYPALNLAQLQVYEAITSPGVNPMAQPTVQPARVGVQGLVLYPWLTPSSLSLYQAGGNGANLYGLKTMNMDLTLKQAVVEGGETEHPIAGFGTGRQMKVGFENAKSDLSTFQKVFGGVFTLIAANGNGPEVQYFTENYADRELYVALVAQSTNGDGNELIVLPKLKVESVSYQLDKDKVTDIKMDFMRFWDYTYTRQDGQIGGIYERLFAASGAAAFHS